MSDTAPAWLAAARAELGVRETPGRVSTKRIIEYRRLAGIPLGGDDGEVPWCAIFVGAMLKGVGHAIGNAMARSYLRWGVAAPGPVAGAVLVFSSSRGPNSGHVGFATGRVTATHVESLGGNQRDSVCTAWFPRKLLLACRWPAGAPLPAGKPVIVAAPIPTGPVKDA